MLEDEEEPVGALDPAVGHSETPADPEQVRLALERILHLHESIRNLRVQVALAVSEMTDAVSVMDQGLGALDVEKYVDVNRLARQPGMTLPALVGLLRGETTDDPRPNKALRPSDYAWLLKGYEHVDFMVSSASHGLQPEWRREQPEQVERPRNHQSALRHKEAITRSVRAGQDGGQYIVLDERLLDEWPGIQVSPLSAVDKPGKDPAVEVRLIHDLSYPNGQSTNDATDRSILPQLTYRPVAELARRIEDLHQRDIGVETVMMKGDVKAAFRHLMVDCRWVGWMAAALSWLGVFLVDLSAPFGWTSSPTYYGAYGGAVTWLVARESPSTMDPTDDDSEPFFSYEWVDDHVLIEPRIGSRPALAAAALRLGIMAVFGPRALNEDKFSEWATKLEVLGLVFDTQARTVSMPQRKLDKALGRVLAMMAQTRTTRTGLKQLLGSLRHVCTCCRAVKPFYQRLQALQSCAPAHGSVAVSASVRQELEWLAELLRMGRFRDLPTSMFGAWPEPDIHLYMDASNAGLAVLDPARRRFIQVRFDEEELALIGDVSGAQAFTINVREQLSITLAALLWGPAWKDRVEGSIAQVWCWVDNTTAVASTNKLYSRNPYAQELNRAIGMAEAVHGFRVRCLHVPGSANVMADAASRAWSPPFTDLWNVLRQGWTHDPVPTHMRKPYAPHSATSSATVWLAAQPRSTKQPGLSGQRGVTREDGLLGYPPTNNSTLNSSCCLPSTAGDRLPAAAATQLRPCCPSSAMSLGVIASTVDTAWASIPGITWPCKGCAGCRQELERKHPPPSPSSAPSGRHATSPPPTTAFFGGLQSWASSIFYEAASTCASTEGPVQTPSPTLTSRASIIKEQSQSTKKLQ